MNSQTFVSKLFIDGGDPEETRRANELLKTKKPEWNRGIEGQTTNPTLVSKNPDVQKYLATGKKLTSDEALQQYKKIVEAVAHVTKGPISIQVIADQTTAQDEMLRQARIYKDWIANGVVKFPCTHEGLSAAATFCEEFPVNITLNFSQSQAAAVYGATTKHKHQVFVSPFIGRLDDRGENGMDVVVSEVTMYTAGDHHVDVLTASLRTLEHLLYAVKLNSPAITIPFKIFQQWAYMDFPLPDKNFSYVRPDLKSIPYLNLDLHKPWTEFDLHHDLTDAGLTKFMQDWQSMLL